MKKQSSLLLILMLLLVLAGCGAKPAPTEPPELTVTNAQGTSITAMGGSYDWDYEAGGGQRTGAIACGMHPLDETLRDSTPALEMPIAVSASFYYTVTLDFGDCAPDSVILRYWNEQCWGDTQAKAEKLTVQRQDDGTYTVELFPSVGIFEVDAQWDAEDYCGRAFYSFCTKAKGSEALHTGAVLSIGESEDIRKIDISWRGGCVNIYAAEQSAQISVKEESTAPLAESEKMVCAIDGDTLRIRFLGDAYRGSYDGEKYLDVGLPAELVSAGHFEKIEVETTDAYTIVGADVSGSIRLSTVGGDARVMGASCPAVEIETTSGKVDIAGALGTLDFESVSGDLILATDRALRLDAETESGSIHLTLPAQDGFTLDYETEKGSFDSALTEREGTLIACGDRATHYSVPALEGGAVSELEISTVSGTLTIEASAFGCN